MPGPKSRLWRIALLPAVLIISSLACISSSNEIDSPSDPPPSSTPIPNTPVPSNTPAPPTDTPVPSATPLPSSITVEDAVNDGLNCTNGEFLSGDTPLDVDITMVHAEFMPNMLHVDVEIGQVDMLNNVLFGGVEFRDSSTANSDPDPNWYFNGRGNKNFSFQYSPPTFLPAVHVFDPATGWTNDPNSQFKGMVDGNHILFDIPAGEVPPDSFFYVSITNFSACDQVGLDPNGVPELIVFPSVP